MDLQVSKTQETTPPSRLRPLLPFRLILPALLMLLLVACGGSEGEVVRSPDASPYQLLISSSELTPTDSRLVLTLWDGPQRMTGAQALDVTLFRIDEQGQSQEQVWEGAATPYQMNDLQYWVAYPSFPEAGDYGVEAIVTTEAGERVENRALLRVKEDTDVPLVGEPAPRSETRTLADAPIEALTSAGPYIERFYEMSVADAADSGQPTIVAFATPGYCTTALCAPVLQTVETVSEEFGDAVNVVHVEVWRDYANQEIEPAVDEWHLQTEPWIFVLNRDGTVGARLEGPVSPEELRQVVEEVRGG